MQGGEKTATSDKWGWIVWVLALAALVLGVVALIIAIGNEGGQGPPGPPGDAKLSTVSFSSFGNQVITLGDTTYLPVFQNPGPTNDNFTVVDAQTVRLLKAGVYHVQYNYTLGGTSEGMITRLYLAIGGSSGYAVIPGTTSNITFGSQPTSQTSGMSATMTVPDNADIRFGSILQNPGSGSVPTTVGEYSISFLKIE